MSKLAMQWLLFNNHKAECVGIVSMTKESPSNTTSYGPISNEGNDSATKRDYSYERHRVT